MRELPINFIGNIEARNALSGDADVLVCDGFTGNILLKTTEGTLSAFSTLLKRELKSSYISTIGAILIKRKLSNLKKMFDYKEEGGALLLGVSKCVVKAHGSSDAKAYKNALRQAYSFTKNKVIDVITDAVSKSSNSN